MEPNDTPERDEGDEAFERLALPLLIPAVVFLFAVLVIYGLSRIYLELDTYHVGDVSMATPLAIGVSIVILLLATYFASQKRISMFQVLTVFVIGSSLLTAGGIWAAVHEESTGEEPAVDGPMPTGEPPVDGGAIQVGLIDPDWAVSVAPASAPAGEVTFAVVNEGTLVHNFRLVQSDLPPGGLPIDEENFQVDEDAVDVVAETREIAVGQAADAVAELVPGSYVLICNIPAHYESGMFVGFAVE